MIVPAGIRIYLYVVKEQIKVSLPGNNTNSLL